MVTLAWVRSYSSALWTASFFFSYSLSFLISACFAFSSFSIAFLSLVLPTDTLLTTFSAFFLILSNCYFIFFNPLSASSLSLIVMPAFLRIIHSWFTYISIPINRSTSSTAYSMLRLMLKISSYEGYYYIRSLMSLLIFCCAWFRFIIPFSFCSDLFAKSSTLALMVLSSLFIAVRSCKCLSTASARWFTFLSMWIVTFFLMRSHIL